jgi:hypothetical protein
LKQASYCYCFSLLANSLHPDYVDGNFLRNIGSYEIHKTSHPRKRHSSFFVPLTTVADHLPSETIFFFTQQVITCSKNVLVTFNVMLEPKATVAPARIVVLINIHKYLQVVSTHKQLL